MDVYKNTETLLKRYRDVVWNIEVASIQLNTNNENPINEFLEIGYTDNIQIEEQTKTLEKNKKILNLIDSALDLIQNKQKNGQEYYKILYYTYISTEQFSACSEIIDKLNEDGFYMSDKTYFRKKNQAIKLLSEILF